MLKELIKAIYAIAKAIKGESDEGGGDEKFLGYFELTNKPIGVIETNKLGLMTYNEETLIKIDENFIEELKVLKEQTPVYVFVYDKDVSNTVNFIKMSSYNAKIANGTQSCIQLAQNRFVIREK